MEKPKLRYRQYTDHHYVPLFFRPWYLDAVTDGQWDVILAIHDKEIVGAFIYFLKKKWAIRYIFNPSLCPYTGPIIFDRSRQKEILTQLWQSLPNHDIILQSWLPEIYTTPQNAQISQKTTFLIDCNTSIDDLWTQLSGDYRRKIRKATQNLKIKIIEDVDLLLDFSIKNFPGDESKFPYPRDLFHKMDKATKIHGNRKIVGAIDNNNRLVAMAYFLYDEMTTYNMINAAEHSYNHHGMNLLIWKEIEHSVESGKIFDFEGSSIKGVQRFYKGFGGSMVKYPHVKWTKNFLMEWILNQKI